MNGLEVADPYVERLLEGVGFLAARVQLKIDAEFPRFTQALLEIVLPHYLAPIPSMLVAQIKPEADDPNLASRLHRCPRFDADRADGERRRDRVRVPHGARRDAVPDPGRRRRATSRSHRTCR